MDMLSAMRIFQRVASTLSFTDAGDSLGLSASSVSRQMDALENQLGVKLLTRTTRKLSLTEAGATYKENLDTILAELDGIHESISSFSDEAQGRLKVSSPRMFGKRLVTPLIHDFLRAHPKVTLELAITDDYVDLVETDTDIVIRIGELGDSSLVSRPLGRYRRVLCCHPSYLVDREAPRVPADLAHFNCLRYRKSGERVIWKFSCPGTDVVAEITPQGNLIANDVEAIYAAALDGTGIGLLPYWLAREALLKGDLIELMPDHPLQSSLQATGIHFVYNVNRRQSRKVHAFMDFIIPRIAPLLV
ncbi:LysR family transcriptional regulator [Pandoraea bronchicola]|uniref:LysR family transcriptional regulator n=1 Tax=Pandoraea bronchicola TaxID=2508287 RepID=A0A5E5BS45_9BURK|nr:LysR family transcriptional regulator [Pandoraea bronchicola]VVE88619.1 LysR family transcriptional regulator [Pandoraea bronchicola]